ncbi:hypothetical protein V1512DRAFT_226929 [Lipomyces arxii]|uniref:uncharacterized protein n=1 Tax=Lipomyces arxii TaxID=56418 RepID=UPI0034CF9A8B
MPPTRSAYVDAIPTDDSLPQDLYSAEDAKAIAESLAEVAVASQPVARKRKTQGESGSDQDLSDVSPQMQLQAHQSSMQKRKTRTKWTDNETNDLLRGCNTYGVGNWKKILLDSQFHFNNRSAVDLKDRFRTYFPDEYRRLYPNATTHGGRRQRAPLPNVLPKVNRKERRSFTVEEDNRLLEGFLKHGPSWSKIQKDDSLQLFERRSTDLRDRFRNAFPEKYAAAGFKTRLKNGTVNSRQTRTAPVDPISADSHVSDLVVNMLANDVPWQTDDDNALFASAEGLEGTGSVSAGGEQTFYDTSSSMPQMDSNNDKSSIPIDPKVTEASARRE